MSIKTYKVIYETIIRIEAEGENEAIEKAVKKIKEDLEKNPDYLVIWEE